MYILTSVWVVYTPIAGGIMLFDIFSTKNVKKEEKGRKKGKMRQQHLFWACIQTLVEYYITRQLSKAY